MATINGQINPIELALGAKFLHAYTECSDDIQAGIRDMLAIIFDESADADADERTMAMHTLADSLYPNFHEGQLGVDLEQSEAMGAQHSEETREAVEEMDNEECAFAQRLSEFMSQRGLTQVALAEISGVGQPAISNMLNRQCRPQRRTIMRFADVFGVEPESLWPGFQN